MKTDTVIREYRLSDFKDLVQAGFPFSTAEWGSIYKDLRLKAMNFLEQTEHKKFVAYSLEDKKAVGVITIKKITRSLWGIWNIFVSPYHRRRGISLALYQKSFDYLRKRGVEKAVGSVEVTNIPSIKSIKRVWDGFLSQKFYECQGNVRHNQRNSQKAAARKTGSFDQDALFEIYRQCAGRDWYTFLEIDKTNFLQRFIEHKYYRGPLRFLLERQTLAFESECGALNGYAIAPTRKWPLRGPSERVYFFMSPQLTPDEAVDLINEMFGLKSRGNFTKVSMFTLNTNEKLLLETSRMLRADFNFKVLQHMVPIKKL